MEVGGYTEGVEDLGKWVRVMWTGSASIGTLCGCERE